MAFNCKMHERNIYRNRPDFEQIALDYPSFRKYAIPNAKGKVRVDFTNTDALRMLTKILLKKDFNLDVAIPEGFLIPTVPQRLNYILWVEDILEKVTKTNENITGVDIGTGPCAIFSLLGAKKNNWNFIATETSDEAIKWAQKNIDQNNLMSNIKVMKVNQDSTFTEVVEVLSSNKACYEFSLCNPPFFENPEEIRKKHQSTNETIADVAQADEIFYKGGEIEFVRNMLKESLVFKNRIRLYTSMFGKKNSYLQILKELKEIEGVKFASTEFCQGNTVRWGIAWTFDESIQFEEFKKKKKPKQKKSKSPLEFDIPFMNAKDCDLEKVLQKSHHLLNDLEISVSITKSSKLFAEFLLKADRNTWTHQRRKRREMERQKKVSDSDMSYGSSFSAQDSKTSFKPFGNDSKTTSSTNSFNLSPEKDSLENPHIKLETTNELDMTHVTPLFLDNQKVGESSDFVKIEPGKNKTFVKSESSICEDISLQPSKVVSKLSHIVDSDNNVHKNKINEATLIKIETCSFVNQMLCDDSINVNQKRKKDFSHGDSVESKKTRLSVKDESESRNMDQGTVLYCHLRFIKGKNKIYIKMDCPETADRNTMYQVFQIIKNKLK